MGPRKSMALALSAISLIALVALPLVTACEHEDWGGPKGAPIASASATPPWTPPGFDASAGPSAGALDAGRLFASPGAADAGPTTVHVEGEVTGGKVPDWEQTLKSLRPSIRACAEGKGEVDAVVEISAKIGPKGQVTGADKTGGSQFAQGVVPCIMHQIEGSTFGKPTAGTPRLTVRVRLRKD